MTDQFNRRKFMGLSGSALGIGIIGASTGWGVIPRVFGQPGRSGGTATDWLHAAQWGVFNQGQMAECQHPPITTVRAWNAAVDAYDTEAVANQLQRLSAAYLIHCLGQNSGFYCSPNATYDNIVGHTPSRMSSRDLVLDLYKSLHSRGIHLMVYLPSGAPANDLRACAALQWRDGKYRLSNFQLMWQNIIAEWSKRWGSKVRGWWFDGCYYGDAMYNFAAAPNWASFAAAARAGNSDSLVAFNPGTQNPIQALAPQEDYTAGEENSGLGIYINSRWTTAPADATEGPNPKVLTQCLTFGGKSWAEGDRPKYTNPELISITNSLVNPGGAMTWDMPIINPSGLIHTAFEVPFTEVADQLLGRDIVKSSSDRIMYGGGQWTRSAHGSSGYYGDEVYIATTDGGYAELSFNGSGIQVFSERGSDMGDVHIYLDGKLTGIYNCFIAGTRRTQQVIYEVKDLSSGSHRVRLVKAGGTYCILGAFRVLSRLQSVVNDRDPAIKYVGSGWSAEAGRCVTDYNQDIHFTTHLGDYFSYTFVGTGIQYLTETDSDMGDVEVYLDGASQGVHSCYAAPGKTTQQPVFKSVGLTYGSHTLKVKMISGRYCRLDCLRVFA
jgi:hypothetical protein